MSVMSVVCCQVEVSATVRSLDQRSPTVCVCVCMSLSAINCTNSFYVYGVRTLCNYSEKVEEIRLRRKEMTISTV